MKYKKKRAPGAYLKKRKVKKYQGGGEVRDVKDLLQFLGNYDTSQYVQVPGSEYINPLQQVVSLPAAEVVTDKGPGYDRGYGAQMAELAQGDMRGFTSLLTEHMAMTKGDLAAVYKELGSEGVDKYLDMTQGVVDAQNQAQEIANLPLYFTPLGTQAFLAHMTQHPEEYNPNTPEGALRLGTALATLGRGKFAGLPRYNNPGALNLRQGVRNVVRKAFGKDPVYQPDQILRRGEPVGTPFSEAVATSAAGLGPEARAADLYRRTGGRRPPSSSGMFGAMEEAAVEAEILRGEEAVLGQRGLPGTRPPRQTPPKRARATEYTDLVWRAGDLKRVPPDTQVGMMSDSRSTGHFGTGFYFYGDEREAVRHAQERSTEKMEGVVSVVNINDYNLAPASHALHDALRSVNRHGSIKSMDFERVASVLGRYDELFGGDFEANFEKGQELAKKANEMLNKPGNIDSKSTIVMKVLGYDGVNAVGTELDKYAYGTVIYDVKPESVRNADWMMKPPQGPGAEGADPVQPRPSTVYGTHGKNLRDGNEPSWRVLRNQPAVSAAQHASDYNPEGIPEGADAAAVVRHNEAQEYQANIIAAHSDVYGGGRNRSNVSQLPVLMHGSKLENSIDKNGNISVSQIQQLIDKGQMSQPEAEALQSALEKAILNEKAKVVTAQIGAEAFAAAEEGPSAFFERKKLLDAVDVKKVSWNDLKRFAVDTGSPYKIVHHEVAQRSDGSVRANRYQTLGIAELYAGAPEGSAVYDIDPLHQTAKTTTITTTNPLLKNISRLGNHFGENVLGHYRSFRRYDEPGILYITEIQADPLQDRPEEFSDGMSGKIRKTRQLGLPGTRRFNDKFRSFQIVAAENLDYAISQIQKEFIEKYYDILKDPAQSAHRLSAIRTLQNQLLSYSDDFYAFDDAMLQQMMNDARVTKPWYKGNPASNGAPLSIDLAANRLDQRLDVQNVVTNIMYELETLIEKVDRSPLKRDGYVMDADMIQAFRKMNDQIAEKVEQVRDMLNGVGDNLYHYRKLLEEGYNGQLTPLQAKLVKNQDQFVVGKILEAESDGALHIRFPKGKTVGTIQGYETVERQVAMLQRSIDYNDQQIQNARSRMMKVHGSEVMQWTPRNQDKSLENMSNEEFIVWWSVAENNEPAYKEMKRQAQDIASRDVERKLEAVRRQLRDMGINPRRVDALDDMSNDALYQIFYDNDLVVGSRYDPDSPVYRELITQGKFGYTKDAVIRERAGRIEAEWEDLVSKMTDVNAERAHLQSVQGGGNTDEAQQAIMDGYDALTKAFKKHKLTYREVTDEFGNAWYEVDVPANLNMNAGEIRSYKRGGRVGMRVKKKAPFKLIKK